MNKPSLTQDNLSNIDVGADLINKIRTPSLTHKRIYGDNNSGYMCDPITGIRLRPKNIHKMKCGHHTTKNTFNKMVRKSPKTYSVEHKKYVLQCAICRDVIHVCNY
jgi:hypothetical protein